MSEMTRVKDILADIADVIVAWPNIVPPEAPVQVRADLLTRTHNEIERLQALTGGQPQPMDKPVYRCELIGFARVGEFWIMRGVIEDEHPAGMRPGDFMVSSAVMSIDFGTCTAVTKNSIYRFGK